MADSGGAEARLPGAGGAAGAENPPGPARTDAAPGEGREEGDLVEDLPEEEDEPSETLRAFSLQQRVAQAQQGDEALIAFLSPSRMLDVPGAYASFKESRLLDVTAEGLAPGTRGSVPQVHSVQRALLPPLSAGQLAELGATLSFTVYATAHLNHLGSILHALSGTPASAVLQDELRIAYHFHERLTTVMRQRGLALASAARGDPDSGLLRQIADFRASVPNTGDAEMDSIVYAVRATELTEAARQGARLRTAAQTRTKTLPAPNYNHITSPDAASSGNFKGARKNAGTSS
jgi:hypothetical protein